MGPVTGIATSIAAGLMMLAQVAGPPGPPAQEAVSPVTPMIGLEGPELDACGGIGSIGNYQASEVVRSAPDDGAAEADRLPHTTLVWLCEAKGEWQGIVYPSGEFQDLGDCQVSSPVSEARAYDGPCRFGWVRAGQLQLVAG
ncbi:MAG: hypothetical protein IE933_14070 [Sphingomonadales bacterium]|nr:hypothetical protein [Sphingomonadales bacterium]MBD3773233.1 hypothetical protein [Paracoccaceae bacterium]